MAGKNPRGAKVRRLVEAVREVLIRDWDPIGVADVPTYQGEYDSYAWTIGRYLMEGADEFKLLAYLSQVQTVSMGLARVDPERDHQVVRQLLTLAGPSSGGRRPPH